MLTWNSLASFRVVTADPEQGIRLVQGGRSAKYCVDGESTNWDFTDPSN